MYYIHYNEETGEILGIYPSSENFDDIPVPNITITDDDLEVITNGYYIVQDGSLVEVEQQEEEIDNQPEPPIYDEDEINNQPEPPDDGSISQTDTNITIVKLQAEYAKYFEKLKRAYLGAAITDNSYTADAIQADYRALLNEFTRKVFEIEASNSIATNDYCEICGTQTVDGICPNCRWRQ